MLKGDALVGKPIIAYNTSQRIAYVQGALIDGYANRLAAFWVSVGAAKEDLWVLPWSGVKAVEPDRVVAWSANMLAPPQDLFSIWRLLGQKTIQSGIRFETTEHQNLGVMIDYYFDENTGSLEGYEVVTGTFAEAINDHGFLPAPLVVSLAKDVVLVSANTHDAMKEKPGGLPILLTQIQDLIKAEGPKTEDALIRHLLPQLEGLRVQHSVWLKNGVMLVAYGQIINAALIKRVQEYQAERQLIEAVGIDLEALLLIR
jgi:uncharacterized protein YrrD